MIELRTLGGVDLRSAADDITLPLTAQPKRLALLVFLSLEELSGYRRRDQVVGLFWPELDTVHARGALRQALHALRRAMGEGAILTRGNRRSASTERPSGVTPRHSASTPTRAGTRRP